MGALSRIEGADEAVRRGFAGTTNRGKLASGPGGGNADRSGIRGGGSGAAGRTPLPRPAWRGSRALR